MEAGREGDIKAGREGETEGEMGLGETEAGGDGEMEAVTYCAASRAGV